MWRGKSFSSSCPYSDNAVYYLLIVGHLGNVWVHLLSEVLSFLFFLVSALSTCFSMYVHVHLCITMQKCGSMIYMCTKCWQVHTFVCVHVWYIHTYRPYVHDGWLHEGLCFLSQDLDHSQTTCLIWRMITDHENKTLCQLMKMVAHHDTSFTSFLTVSSSPALAALRSCLLHWDIVPGNTW